MLLLLLISTCIIISLLLHLYYLHVTKISVLMQIFFLCPNCQLCAKTIMSGYYSAMLIHNVYVWSY